MGTLLWACNGLPLNTCISMYARTNRCYNERGSRTNYIRSSIPHFISFQPHNSATLPTRIHHQKRLFCTQYKRVENAKRFYETNHRHYPLEVTVVTIPTACLNFKHLCIFLTQCSPICLTLLSHKTENTYLSKHHELVDICLTMHH